jgi:hypothetical protein
MKTQTPQVHQARKMSCLRALLVNSDGVSGLNRSATRREKKRRGERIDRRNESTVLLRRVPEPVTIFTLRPTHRLARSKLTRQTPSHVRISAGSRSLGPLKRPNGRSGGYPRQHRRKLTLAGGAPRIPRMTRTASASMLPRLANFQCNSGISIWSAFGRIR